MPPSRHAEQWSLGGSTFRYWLYRAVPAKLVSKTGIIASIRPSHTTLAMAQVLAGPRSTAGPGCFGPTSRRGTPASSETPYAGDRQLDSRVIRGLAWHARNDRSPQRIRGLILLARRRTPSLSCSRVTAHPRLRCCRQPPCVRYSPRTLNFDLEDAKRRLTKNTRAIEVVHLFGLPCDMQAICDFAKEKGLLVLEDCAHAHNASINGKYVGNWGQIGAFSCQGSKVLPAIEGGTGVGIRCSSIRPRPACRARRPSRPSRPRAWRSAI